MNMTDNFKTVYLLTKAAWNEEVDTDRNEIIQYALCIPHNALRAGLISQIEYSMMLDKINTWPHEGHNSYFDYKK